MSLKEQVPNVYAVGLRNVGSYQVSGVPHITSSTIAARAETTIEFPMVTKNITFNKTTTGGDIRVHFKSHGAQKPALEFQDDPTDGIIDDYFITPLSINASTAFTTSWWFKQNSTVSNWVDIPIWYMPGGSGVYSQYGKIQVQASTNRVMYKTYIRDNGGAAAASLDVTVDPYDQTGYHNYVISVQAGSYKVYVDGVDHGAGSRTLPNGAEEFNSFRFPRQTTGVSLSLQQNTVWNKALSDSEVNELFNQGAYKNPNDHSFGSNLQHWLAFDNTISNNPDTAASVFDRVGSMTGSITTKAGQTTSTEYVDGAPDFLTGSNVVAQNHYITLTDARPTLTLSCKCSEVYLSAVGSTQSINVMSELTGIPASRMYALTGSGIDE